MGTVRINELNSSPSTRFIVEGDLHSQSIAGNYSVIRCYIAAYNEGNSTSHSSDPGFQAGTIVGVKEFARKSGHPFLPSGYGNGQRRWRLGPYDVRVDHEPDGTHDPIQFGMVLDYTPVSETKYSGLLPLPTIPRASTSTFAGGSTFDAGAAVTINTNRADPGFTHKLYMLFGGTNEVLTTNAGGSYTWTPPLSLLNEFPDATTLWGRIQTTTYDGSAQIGEPTYTKFTLRAPASVVPTVSAVTVADQNPDVASVVGKFVQGLSVARFGVTAEGAYGSTISKREVTFQGATQPAGADVPVAQSGSLPVAGKVTDSRGRTATESASLPVLPYSAPAVTAYQVRRSTSAGVVAEDGQHLRVDLTATIASLVNGTERNALKIRAFTRAHGTGAWTARNVINPGGLTYNTSFVVSGGGVFSTTSSYDVRVQVEDKFGAYIAYTVVATIAVALDLNGNRVGVGKIWEQGTLDVGGDVHTSGDLHAVGGVSAAEVNAGKVNVSGTGVGLSLSDSRVDGTHYAYAMAAGSVNVTASNNSTGQTTVSFPSGRFTQTPIINLAMWGAGSDRVVDFSGPSASGMTVRIHNRSGGTVTHTVHWTAVQMTPTSGAG